MVGFAHGEGPSGIPGSDRRRCAEKAIHLRLAPCRNNQKQSIHWASQYELGAIAQLGERLHGMQEVAGSSPASSTPVEVAAQAASTPSGPVRRVLAPWR